MDAVVLAAGRGERLWPLTETRPKPLLPIVNRPILERTIESIIHAGVEKIVLVVNYKMDMIREQLGDGSALGCDIEYVKQKSVRGTADALGTVQTKLAGEDRFLVIYGDDYYEKETVKDFVETAERNEGVTMSTAKVEDASQFGLIESKKGVITQIREKISKSGPGIVNAGLYMMTPKIFSSIKKTSRSKRGELELTDSLTKLIRNGEQVHSEQLRDSGWLGISYPWDLLEANQRILSRENVSLNGTIEDGVQVKGSVVVDEEALVKSGSRIEGPVHIGKRCQVGPNAYLRAYSCLGDEVKVGAACEVKNTIVMNGSKIPHLSYVGDSVIGSDCSLGAGTITANLRFDESFIKSRVRGALVESGRKKLGAILGDNVRTGINVSIFPGVKIGKGAWVGPGAIVEKDVASAARVKA